MVEDISSSLTYVDMFNLFVFLVFTLCYGYQIVYAIIVFFKKPTQLKASKNHRFAVLIPARNESAVISNLIHSIHVQNYPSELIDIFVIADNCTDNTGDVARQAGAHVITRHNKEQVGKGYALDYGFSVIRSQFADKNYEAYFVFDADNVLDENYFREMNKVYDNGAKASTSYRNSKNFGSNWISAGYGILFLREAKFLSQARLVCNSSCAISGTGWFIAADIIEKNDGWRWFLLTEDIEFSVANVLDGVKISYCPTAIIYDEQPVTFRDQWNQRFRWAKGFYQVFGCYGWRLFKGIFKNNYGNRWAHFDMLMTVTPAMLLTISTLAFNTAVFVLGLLGYVSAAVVTLSALSSVLFCVFNFLVFNLAFSVLTTIVEWKSIHMSTGAKIKYAFTYPFFQMINIPIVIVALFGRPNWKPIPHNISVDVTEFAKAASLSTPSQNRDLDIQA